MANNPKINNTPTQLSKIPNNVVRNEFLSCLSLTDLTKFGATDRGYSSICKPLIEERLDKIKTDLKNELTELFKFLSTIPLIKK